MAPSDCPSWCDGVHRTHLHRIQVGSVRIGHTDVKVVLHQDPDREPTAMICHGAYVTVQADELEDMARLMDLCGKRTLAALIRKAAETLAGS